MVIFYFLLTSNVTVFLACDVISDNVIVSFPVLSSNVYCEFSNGISSTFIVSLTRVIKVGFRISVITGLVYDSVVALFISILYVRFPSLHTGLSAYFVTVNPDNIVTTRAVDVISVGILL